MTKSNISSIRISTNGLFLLSIISMLVLLDYKATSAINHSISIEQQSIPPPEITEIEINQSIKVNPPGPYVVGRKTAILAHVDPSSHEYVWGHIRILGNDSGAINLWAKNNPLQQNSGVNELIFEPIIITSPSSIDVTVTLFYLEPGFTFRVFRTSQSLNNLNFSLEPVQPQFHYVSVNFTGTTPALPDANLISGTKGDAMLRATWPLSNEDANWFYQEIQTFPGMYSYVDHMGNGEFSYFYTMPALEGLKLLEDLEETRNTTCSNPPNFHGDECLGTNQLMFLSGWVSDSTGTVVSLNGVSIDQNVGYGTSYGPDGQLIFVHELHHMLEGDAHLGGNQTGVHGWDVDNFLPANWVLGSPIVQRKEPTYISIFSDLDSPSSSSNANTANSWISASRFFSIQKNSPMYDPQIRSMLEEPIICEPNETESPQKPCLQRNNYVFTGSFDESGEELVNSGTTIQLPWLTQPSTTYTTSRPEEYKHVLRFVGAEGVVDIPFGARILLIDQEKSEEVVYGPFSVVVPPEIVEQAESISIIDRDTGNEIPYLTRSGNIPSVEVISPQPGGILEDTIQIITSDADLDEVVDVDPGGGFVDPGGGVVAPGGGVVAPGGGVVAPGGGVVAPVGGVVAPGGGVVAPDNGIIVAPGIPSNSGDNNINTFSALLNLWTSSGILDSFLSKEVRDALAASISANVSIPEQLLHCRFIFSSDGRSWMPVAAPIPCNPSQNPIIISLDTTLLPNTEEGILKVIVSDGFNIISEDVQDLTVNNDNE